jgi:hypothetical protein
MQHLSMMSYLFWLFVVRWEDPSPDRLYGWNFQRKRQILVTRRSGFSSFRADWQPRCSFLSQLQHLLYSSFLFLDS